MEKPPKPIYPSVALAPKKQRIDAEAEALRANLAKRKRQQRLRHQESDVRNQMSEKGEQR